MIYRIRAHHGMCFSFFEGKGYSGEFVRNMQAVQDRLDKNPQVLLLDEADEVCAGCPNNQEGTCTSAEKVQDYDRQVLKYCRLAPGTLIRWKEFEAKVREHVLDKGRREEICGNCQWNEICKNFSLQSDERIL
ncbi:MAG: DUF1284 domain-containing protein [Lachnospiraceae bacterium]|nr:DUF1284 domain-containing protein [Lachnospiraceae bacterium]